MTAPASQGLDSVAGRIDAIEEAYEYCLAYAAQGRRGDEGGPMSEIRHFLERALAALDGLAEAARTEFADAGTAGTAAGPFLDVVSADLDRARAVIRLVLAQETISSQLVDNLNASIHLRALLTDLFLIDESLKGGSAA